MTEASAEDAERRAGLAARALVDHLLATGRRVAFAESCTGGLLSALLTEVPGASKVFWGGVVSYTEEAKTALLGVDPALIAREGVVSKATARAMAEGLLTRSGADIAAAVTGWAGPEAPEGEEGPGRVCLAWATCGAGGRESVESGAEEIRFPGGRRQVRLAAALRILEGCIKAGSFPTSGEIPGRP